MAGSRVASTEAFLKESFSRGRNININQIKVVFLIEFQFESTTVMFVLKNCNMVVACSGESKI